ncbi:MAG TPA: POTRA domain-containing protein [Myxococcaceae bacterium]|nr:POTRA domain-containing protein [Myxococcaceae bacterium]
MNGRAAPLWGALLASAALAQAPRLQARPPSVAAAAAVKPPEPEPMGDEPRPTVTAVELRAPQGLSVPPDVRLDIQVGQPVSLRAVRRAIFLLYSTNLYAGIEARLEPTPGGVRVAFEMSPRQVVKQITVEGNRALSDSVVLKATRLEPKKSEVTDDALRRALDRVEELYRQRGYDQVAATMEMSEQGLQTSLVVQVVEGEPTRVEQLSVAGDPGDLPLDHILETSGLSVGGVLDRAALAEGLEKLRAELRGAHYYRASVGEPVIALEAPWASVSLPISAGPKYRTHFHQNHQVPDAVLEAALDYDATEALDAPLAARLSRRLEAYYQSRGWFEARVHPGEVGSGDGKEAVLHFDIEEGPRLRVISLRFEGNRAVSTPDLLDQVRAAVQRREPLLLGVRTFDSLQIEGRSERPGIREAPALEPEAVYSEEAYREAVEAITDLYRNKGYLSARAQFAEAIIDQAQRTAKVRFTVHEGPRAKVASIGVEGLPPGVDVPVSAQPLQRGDPASISALERGRKELLQRLAREGYLYSRVDPDTRISGDGSEMDVVYRVDPGPQVRVGQVLLRRADKSDRQMVLANFPLKSGDVLTPERLLDSQRALTNLGAYRQVAVRLVQPEQAEPRKDVTVELTERPTTEGEVGVGLSAVDGPRILLDGSYPNIFGQALNLEGRGKIHWIGAGQAFAGAFGFNNSDVRDFSQPSSWYGIGGKVTLSLRAPRVRQFLPAAIGAHVDLVGEHEFRSSFQFATLAGIAGLDWQATRYVIASIQYNLELDRVCTYQLRGQPFDCGSGGLADLLTDQDRRNFFQFDSFLLQSLAPSLSVDLRDDPANPTRGLLASLSAELTNSLLERYKLLGVKAQGSVTGYLPLAKRVVVAASVRGGRFVPLTGGQDHLPPPKRFYMGGFSTLRGFQEDGLLPEDRRTALRATREECASLVNRTGCSRSALALLAGSQIPSEGGEVYTLAKLELRLPFLGAMDLGAFIEAGNLWSDTTTVDLLHVRPVAGGGIRYETPIGPLALDVGFNLHPDDQVNEQTFNFHFNIGLF